MRWASPVIYMRRTVTRDIELSGVKMAEGDKVAHVVRLGQPRRGEVRRPVAFDVTRTPNHHVGFGGGGAHFCLGANLARREIAVVFEELRRGYPTSAVTEEPAVLLSQFIHGIKRLPVAWTPPG